MSHYLTSDSLQRRFMHEKQNLRLEDIFTDDFLYDYYCIHQKKLEELVPFEQIYLCKYL